jgi:hypothetical protein
LEEDDEHISSQNAQLGQDITDIFNIMHLKMKEDFFCQGEIVMRN